MANLCGVYSTHERSNHFHVYEGWFKVIRMAAPFKNFRAVVYFLSVIPVAFRLFFDGELSEYK